MEWEHAGPNTSDSGAVRRSQLPGYGHAYCLSVICKSSWYTTDRNNDSLVVCVVLDRELHYGKGESSQPALKVLPNIVGRRPTQHDFY